MSRMSLYPFESSVLIDLLATNGTVPKGFLFLILKSYFDGGNQGDSRQYDVLSLAVMSGTKDVWLPFAKAWNGVLRKHKVGYLHTSDAVARKGIYNGWKVTQRDALLRDCVRVAARYCARAAIGEVPGKYGINCYVVSFNLKDFVARAKIHPQQPKNVYEACLRQAIPHVLQWCDEQAGCDQCHCFFDRGEPFYGILKQLQENKKVLKDAPALKTITHRSESDMRRVPALQLADLYAWSQSHRDSTWKPIWKTKLLSTHFNWQWIDCANLDRVIPAHQEVWQSWNLPKRSPTK